MATETVRNLPAQFVEDLGKDLATQITAQTGTPVVTGGLGSLTQQTGEDAAQFAARQKAATQFGIRQDSLAGLAPQVLSLIHICRCRRYSLCRSRWSPYH